MSQYLPCPLTAVYPILRRIPVEERAQWVAQAERGEPLTPEQSARLGFHPSLTNCGALIPAGDVLLTPAQLESALPSTPERSKALRIIPELGRKVAMA